MTATKSALEDIQPSITAPARPVRLTRLRQRMRGSDAAMREGDLRGAVGRIVVDDDHLPGQAVERRLHAARTAPGRWRPRGRSGTTTERVGALLRGAASEVTALFSCGTAINLPAGRARIREGKPARQAVDGNERKRDRRVAPFRVRANGLRHRRATAPDAAASASARQASDVRATRTPSRPTKIAAAGDEGPAARIVGDHEDGDVGPERERDLSRVRPMVDEHEGGRRCIRSGVDASAPQAKASSVGSATPGRSGRQPQREAGRGLQTDTSAATAASSPRRRAPSGAGSGGDPPVRRARRRAGDRRRTSPASSIAAGRGRPRAASG